MFFKQKNIQKLKIQGEIFTTDNLLLTILCNFLKNQTNNANIMKKMCLNCEIPIAQFVEWLNNEFYVKFENIYSAGDFFCFNELKMNYLGWFCASNKETTGFSFAKSNEIGFLPSDLANYSNETSIIILFSRLFFEYITQNYCESAEKQVASLFAVFWRNNFNSIQKKWEKFQSFV